MSAEDSDDDSIDEEQLDEYRDMVENLGDFPDKVKISSLSMMAEDFSDSGKGSKAIYQIIRQRLMTSTRIETLLPLVYLLDSILKNAKGRYIPIVEEDAAKWLAHVFPRLPTVQKQKVQRMWKTWNDTKLFDDAKLQQMADCFVEKSSARDNNADTLGTDKKLNSTSDPVAGISRTDDGTLILSKALRREMQLILDDMQSDSDEADKISLERLAQINPSLLAKVKATAMEGLGGGDNSKTSATNGSSGNNSSKNDGSNQQESSFLNEARTPQQVERSKAWSEVTLKEGEAPNLVKELLGFVEDCDKEQYTQTEAMEMTQYLAAVSATAQLLSSTLEQIQTESDQKKSAMSLLSNAGAAPGMTNPSISMVNPKDFTNDGLKKKNSAVISMLYEVGLPFVSSADGRRFRSQLELSQHLDHLFKKNQLEKSIAKTEERGWYTSDLVWSRKVKEEDMAAQAATSTEADAATDAENGDGYDPDEGAVIADESRDRCVICGINFKMDFDNDDGQYKYFNCREIDLMNDNEMALNESEEVLVHVTCWRGLGSPAELNQEQVLQEALHRF